MHRLMVLIDLARRSFGWVHFSRFVCVSKGDNYWMDIFWTIARTSAPCCFGAFLACAGQKGSAFEVCSGRAPFTSVDAQQQIFVIYQWNSGSILESRWTSTSCSAIRQCWCSNCWPRGIVRLKSNAPIESLRSDVATHHGWLSLKGILEPRFQECFCWNRSCSVQVQPLFLFRSQRRRLVIEILFSFPTSHAENERVDRLALDTSHESTRWFGASQPQPLCSSSLNQD